MAAQPAGLKRFYTLLVVLGLAGAVAIGMLMRRKPVSIPVNVTVQASDTAGFRGYLLGRPDAPVEVTEFGDYQCPACAGFDMVQFPTVKERLIDGGRVRWRYRDFPLDNIHANARVTAHAAACADEQGKYWDAHRFIYEAQSDWSRSRNPAGDMRSIAKSIGLDLGKYDDCMQSARYAGRIQASYDEAVKLGVSSTPSFMVGGRLYAGALPYDELKKLVDSLAGAPAAPAAP
ncbi:MAG TPA: DsbA family protein [Gemmatimonadales bacterium]|nr:DsbA family protein [Gemmatimonadales bacterium]